MPRQSPRKQSSKPTVVEVTSVKKTVATANGTTIKSKTVVATTKVKATKKRPISDEEADFKHDSPAEEDKKPAVKKRKKAAKKGDEMLAERTAISSLKRAMYIGAHVSGAGGVQNSIQNALNIGANSFAVFLKSQRKWANPPLADDAKNQFLALCKEHKYDAGKYCLPHGSYLVNLAQSDPEKATQAYDAFVDDLRRCDTLGIKLYNFHPGSTGGDTKAAAITRIAAQLNKSHKDSEAVVTVIENMAGSGNVVGSRFEDLRDIIALVDDKARVGVCIDTCHAFAAGYDLRTPAAFAETVGEFDRIVGAKYLRAFHLNDSKAPLASHRDLHANIGTGFLGLRAFHSIMNYEPFQDLPMVLETPIDKKGPDGKSVEDKQVWADEIKLLESLIGMDAESDDFEVMERELQSKGTEERAKIQGQVDKKAAKDAKKGKGRGKKKQIDTDEDDDSE